MNDAREVEAYDQASLESFTSELVAAGFEPVPGTERRIWEGPADPALAPLTSAERMRFVIYDGWPVEFPRLLVDGLHTSHQTAGGYVCLWHDGDGSGEWITLDGFLNRLAEWCHDAEHGWDPDGLARDAYLNFMPKFPTVATFDLDKLQIGAPDAWGSFHGKLHSAEHVSLHYGHRLEGDRLRGLWFQTDALDVPPRNLTELRGALNRAQARGLERQLASRRAVGPLQQSGSVDLILFAWNHENTRHLLVLALRDAGAKTSALALKPGPTDKESLMLRAGPDAALLKDKTVVVFGAGALGGHVALSLAESGVTHLRLIDGDNLLPENAVRHVAGRRFVGSPKPAAVAKVIRDHAPWAQVEQIPRSLTAPAEVAEAIADVDLVVDATGTEATTQALCITGTTHAKPLVSGALYRGGAVSRVRRQGFPGDTPILQRNQDPHYHLIPPGSNDDKILPAVGCSGPVTNAPPSTVLAASALLAEVAIDALTVRLNHSDEVVCVIRALYDEPPFDQIGLLMPNSRATKESSCGLVEAHLASQVIPSGSDVKLP